MFRSCHPIVTPFLLATLTSWFALASAGPLDSVPLKPGSQVPEYCAVGGQPVQASIKRRGGSGTSFFAPWPVDYTMDVAVEGDKEIMLTVLYEEQYNSLAAGRQPSNPTPPLKVMLSGVDSASVVLPRGNYFFAFTSQSDTATQISYRCSYVRR